MNGDVPVQQNTNLDQFNNLNKMGGGVLSDQPQQPSINQPNENKEQDNMMDFEDRLKKLKDM